MLAHAWIQAGHLDQAVDVLLGSRETAAAGTSSPATRCKR
jgi:hypothetical protein